MKMNIKKALVGSAIGMILAGGAQSADFSVGIVNDGTGLLGTGTALNLYEITEKGVDLVKGSPFVFPHAPAAAFKPLVVTISPDHDFAYVAYLRPTGGTPILAQFAITHYGLEYRWQRIVSSGEPDLGSPVDSGISTVSHYVIETLHPYGEEVHILDESGRELVDDIGSSGYNLISGHIDPNGKFYYSCRYLASPQPGSPAGNGPANAVAVYKLDEFVKDRTPPLVTSTDPVFVQSECQ